jgi:hypothetical protein
MITSLKNYINDGDFVSVYDDFGNLDSCSVGVPCRLTDENLLLMQVDENGWYDGYLSILLSNINRLDVRGKYERKLQQLYSAIAHNQSTSSFNLNEVDFDSDISGINACVLEWSYSKGSLLKISIDQTNESAGLIGVVLKMFEETVQLQLIDQYGQKDGVAEFDLSEMQKIYFDSIDLRSIELLMRDTDVG